MTELFKEKRKKPIWLSVYVVEFAVLIVLFIIGSLTIEGFASPMTLVAILVLSSFLGICAGGQTFVVLLGGIDLSIPAMIGVGNVLVGYLNGKGWPFLAIILVIFAIAIVNGVVNGLVSKVFSIHSLITTLATGAIVGGLLLVITGGHVSSSVCPVWLNHVVALNGKMGIIPLPPVIGVWAIYAILALLLLYKMPWGKKLYVSGVNDRAAQLALVNTTSIWAVAFIISAVSAAIAGVLLSGFSGSAFFNVGKPYLFLTIGAVVIGGTSLTGGHGGYDRTIFGALISTLVTTIMIGFGLDTPLQQAFLGFVIILLLGIYGRQQDIRLRM